MASQDKSGDAPNNPAEDSKHTTANPEKSHGPGSADDMIYPTGLKLALIIVSAFTSMFLVSLDRMIITTAIPQITNDFNSVTDIGWYGSAYLLTTCASQLLFGKVYTFFDIKTTFIATVVLFEVGSAICGAAPNSIAFIFGRAIAGVGGAGIYSGGIMIIINSVPLHKRPVYQGMFGAVFGISSVVGPLLGGAFTSKVTWRWCFYINLPFGGVALLAIFLLLKLPKRDSTNLPIKSKLAQLDFYGSFLIIPASICLVLALQWGGLTYAWSDGRIIALLVLTGLLFLGFALVQVFLPKTATLPPRVFLQSSILGGSFASLCLGSQQMLFVYYLPVWFQAVQGVSAINSGLHLLPMLLTIVISSLLTGALVKRIGYYTPFMIVGVCFISVGAGLLNTLQVNTSEGKWIGYQILYGWGMGLTSQAPNLAAQTVLQKKDIAIGTSFMFFSQLLGGAIFVSVGQNVLNNQLVKRLSFVPGFTPEKIKNGGATSLTNFPPSIKAPALVAYNQSLRHVFLVGLILACLSIIGALAMEWRSVKQNKGQQAKKAEEGITAGHTTCDVKGTERDASEKEPNSG